MTRVSQTDSERHYLQAFLPLVGFGGALLQKLDPPRPDFEVSHEARSICIEITEYHSKTPTPSGHTRRLIEQEWERLRQQLMVKVDATPSLAEIHGTVCLRELKVPSRRDSTDFINQLVDCAKGQLEGLPIAVSDFAAYPLLSQFLKQVRLKRIRCHMSWDWNYNTAWIGTEPKAFVETVRAKTEQQYETGGLDDLWLLIVSGPHLSQATGLDLDHHLPNIPKADTLLRSSSFSKAFVFQYMFDVAYEWPGWKGGMCQ